MWESERNQNWKYFNKMAGKFKKNMMEKLRNQNLKNFQKKNVGKTEKLKF